jgi:hypothetical protein
MCVHTRSCLRPRRARVDFHSSRSAICTCIADAIFGKFAASKFEVRLESSNGHAHARNTISTAQLLIRKFLKLPDIITVGHAPGGDMQAHNTGRIFRGCPVNRDRGTGHSHTQCAGRMHEDAGRGMHGQGRTGMHGASQTRTRAGRKTSHRTMILLSKSYSVSSPNPYSPRSTCD